jgi:hypothetical protein
MTQDLTPEAVAKMMERLSDSLEIEAADMMEALAAKLAKKDTLMQAGFAEYERRLALALGALETAKSEMRDWALDHPSMREIDTAIAQIKGEEK